MVTRGQRSVLPVVLSGGSGTRLWPLSTEARPKQFLPLVSASTLYQETLLRAAQLGERVLPPMVVCNAAHRKLAVDQARALGIEPAIVLEPAARNTAPAVAAAALLTTSRSEAREEDPLLLVLPADHVIADVPAFVAAVRVAMEAAAKGYLVTFGLVPTRPETEYGYIRRGEDREGWSLLAKFVEKPDAATAKEYVDSGRYLWNSGMFLFSASALLREIGLYEPTMLEACRAAVGSAQVDDGCTCLGAAFLDCVSKSIDYAVMEKTKRAAVVSLAAGWSDVGSWAALLEVLDKDTAGNAVIGDALTEACSDCYVASNSRFVAAVGLDGVVIVETKDAVLVMSRERAREIKRVVDALKAQERREAIENSKSK